jgi:3',5'-cyclic AMP phosphodiesterase CpdA
MSYETSNIPLLSFPVRAEYPPFAIVSDTHVGARNSAYPAFVRIIEELEIETIIHTGDIINKPGSLRQWKRFFETTGSEKTLHVAPGNHDIRFKRSREVYGRFFPFQYYSFSQGDTLFVMLNTVLPRQRSRIAGRQLEWLQTELKRDFRFKFVFLHEPLFPVLPLHGLNVFRRARNKLHRLFAENGVSLVVAGHNHLYGRSERDDVIYVVTGNTGGKLFPFGLVSKNRGSFRYIVATRIDGHYLLEVRDMDGNVTDRFSVSSGKPRSFLYSRPVPRPKSLLAPALTDRKLFGTSRLQRLQGRNRQGSSR